MINGQLTRPPRHLGLAGPEVIELLAARLGPLPLETVYYSHHGHARSAPPPRLPLSSAIAALAKLVPALEVLAFETGCPPADVDALLPQLPRLFRRLRRAEIPPSFLRGPQYAETLERYRSLPFVELRSPRRGEPS